MLGLDNNYEQKAKWSNVGGDNTRNAIDAAAPSVAIIRGIVVYNVWCNKLHYVYWLGIWASCEFDPLAPVLSTAKQVKTWN